MDGFLAAAQPSDGLLGQELARETGQKRTRTHFHPKIEKLDPADDERKRLACRSAANESFERPLDGGRDVLVVVRLPAEDVRQQIPGLIGLVSLPPEALVGRDEGPAGVLEKLVGNHVVCVYHIPGAVGRPCETGEMAATLEQVAREQARDELFAFRLYSALADRLPKGSSRKMLTELASEERSHVDFWVGVAGLDEAELRPSRVRHWLLVTASVVLGPAFTIRWLERGEDKAIETYKRLLDDGKLTAAQRRRVAKMLREEEEHEQLLESGVEDERRVYLGAAVLGLNDALVELTGGLTGLVSSISDPKLIGFAALVVGIAASMSMAASNFLSVDIGEESGLRPGKAAAYTGIAYIFVVVGLVMPFFVLEDRRVALAISWASAIAIIAAFSFYSSVMQSRPFLRRFALMLALGVGVAVISFGIGHALGTLIGIEL